MLVGRSGVRQRSRCRLRQLRGDCCVSRGIRFRRSRSNCLSYLHVYKVRKVVGSIVYGIICRSRCYEFSFWMRLIEIYVLGRKIKRLRESRLKSEIPTSDRESAGVEDGIALFFSSDLIRRSGDRRDGRSILREICNSRRGAQLF